jgi:hypothetical protein
VDSAEVPFIAVVTVAGTLLLLAVAMFASLRFMVSRKRLAGTDDAEKEDVQDVQACHSSLQRHSTNNATCFRLL